MKTVDQAATKWDASTSIGGQTWLANLQGTTKPITSAAIAQRSLMQQRFAQATAPGGVWERRLTAVGDQGVKAAAAAKSGNYAQGVSQAQPRYRAAITKILAYEAAGLATLPAKAGPGSGKARMDAWFDYMSAGRGTLGA